MTLMQIGIIRYALDTVAFRKKEVPLAGMELPHAADVERTETGA